MPNARIAQRKLYICYKGAHTKLTNHRHLEGRQKGLDTTGKSAKEHKTHALRPKSTQSSPYRYEIGQRAKRTK
jgi:hypothetical protein